MITARSQAFTPAYQWGTITGTAAKAIPYGTKIAFVKVIFFTQNMKAHDKLKY